MALSNAQHQARHRARVKDRLALAAVVERFRQTVAAQVSEAGGDPSSPSVVAGHVSRLIMSPQGAEILEPFLAQAVGVPALRMGDGGVEGQKLANPPTSHP